MKKTLILVAAILAVTATTADAQKKSGEPDPKDIYAVSSDGVIISIKSKYRTLDSLVIPEKIGNVMITAIKSGAFIEMSSLKSVTFPETLERIGGNAFNSTGLYKVEVPEGVTDVGGFAKLANLRVAYLPSTVEVIQPYTFWYNPKMHTLVINAETPPVFPEGSQSKDMTLFGPVAPTANFQLHEKFKIRVPPGSVEAYKTTKPWSFYRKYIVPQAQTAAE